MSPIALAILKNCCPLDVFAIYTGICGIKRRSIRKNSSSLLAISSHSCIAWWMNGCCCFISTERGNKCFGIRISGSSCKALGTLKYCFTKVIVQSEILEVAIAFTKWLIGQARLIYADSGITIHPDSSKITRFVERFRGMGWIRARQVTHWSSSHQKLTANTARAFMKLVVDLGYAVDNKQSGRAYQIKIKDDSGKNW